MTTDHTSPSEASARGAAPSGDPRALRRDARQNQERVLAAATTAVLREGDQVPMASIAHLAGVGIGTLYRRYPTRRHLLGALTERSFRLVWELAQECANAPGPGIDALDRFLTGTIAHRDQLVLPLHGGPTELSADAAHLRTEVSDAIGHILTRGRNDQTIRGDVITSDVITFGALLAQPLPAIADWEGSAHRQKSFFLAGLAPRRAPAPGATPAHEGRT